jgi:hypothetical protein
VNPRYPIYVPSKGRSEHALALTARFLRADGVPFKLVVEPQERQAYAAAWGEDSLLVLPFSNLGLGSTPARNWIWGHAVASGAERHWILDDNIRYIRRWWRGRRLMCDSGPALAACEDFADRYENLAMAGLNYQMFCIQSAPPFYLNVHVYSCILIMNSLPFRWRGRYNEDTDLCLQVLSSGWCTALINVFMANKLPHDDDAGRQHGPALSGRRPAADGAQSGAGLAVRGRDQEALQEAAARDPRRLAGLRHAAQAQAEGRRGRGAQ